jgi:hypothetical protein
MLHGQDIPNGSSRIEIFCAVAMNLTLSEFDDGTTVVLFGYLYDLIDCIRTVIAIEFHYLGLITPT